MITTMILIFLASVASFLVGDLLAVKRANKGFAARHRLYVAAIQRAYEAGLDGGDDRVESGLEKFHRQEKAKNTN